MRIHSILFVSFFLFTLPLRSFGRDGTPDTARAGRRLFVAPDGADSVAYEANDASRPWRTFDKAMKTVRTGDTVLLRKGAYPVTAMINMRFLGKDGTAAKPVLFRPYENDTVVITGAAGIDPLVKIENNFFVFENLSFAADGTCFFLGEDAPATDFVARNCAYAMRVGGDNTGFIHAYGNNARNARVERCVITGPGFTAAGVHGNTAGIIAFRTEGLKLLNNEISNFPIGIYYKHANTQNNPEPGIEIAYNYIENTDRFAMMLNCNHASIHDNVLGRGNAEVEVNEANGVPGGDYNVFEHNTFFGVTLNLLYDTSPGDTLPGAIGNLLLNNVFTAVTELHRYSDVPHHTRSDYNLFPTGDALCENRAYYTLAAWREHAKVDTHSVAGAPVFTGGASPASLAGFRLADGSPGRLAASDDKDMGADISTVGAGGARPVTALQRAFSSHSARNPRGRLVSFCAGEHGAFSITRLSPGIRYAEIQMLDVRGRRVGSIRLAEPKRNVFPTGPFASGVYRALITARFSDGTYVHDCMKLVFER